jgi:hypothetical protein
MPLPIDADILCYLWVTFRVIFKSKARLRANSRQIPLRYEYELVQDESFTPAQTNFLNAADAQLKALGYVPICTYRVRKLGTNMVRNYLNPGDSASCMLTIVEVKVNVDGMKGSKHSSSVLFVTRLANGKRLVTRNTALKSLFDRPDHVLEQRLPNTTDVRELKKKHDQLTQTLGATIPPPQDTVGILRDADAEHERYSQFQLKSGIYQLSDGGSTYKLTDKVFNRGIWNHFVPLGKRISVPQVLFSGLLGAFLPLLGILKLAPWLAEGIGNDAVRASALSGMAIAACYIVAGAIIGWVSDVQKFTWIMLVAYVPEHLIAGWSYGWFPYATLMFVTCFLVGQAKRRRELILQS